MSITASLEISSARLGALTLVRLATRSGLARALREAAEASQAEVAAACDVSHAAVARWEGGQRLPRGEAARRYVRTLTQLASCVGPVEDPALRALQLELLELDISTRTSP